MRLLDRHPRRDQGQLEDFTLLDVDGHPRALIKEVERCRGTLRCRDVGAKDGRLDAGQPKISRWQGR